MNKTFKYTSPCGFGSDSIFDSMDHQDNCEKCTYIKKREYEEIRKEIKFE